MTIDVVSRIRELLDEGPNRGEQKEILDLVRAADPGQLNALLEEIDVSDLLGSVNNRLLGAKRYDQLVQLLTRQRVGELSIHAQAALASALQNGHTNRREERALRDVLRSRRGEELSHLKNTINLTKGRHDLEGLVYRDVDHDKIRDEILAHFRAEAATQGVREAKILSDIDDTAIARIHDDRYPKGTVVPGVLAFYEALDMGPGDEPRSRGDLTFVTARPSDALGLVKGQSRRTLTDAGITDLSIMTGSWFNLVTRDSMATKKVENISHYAALFPEYDLVFIGDSGQGDIVVAQQILESEPDVVKACFIHDVVAMPESKRGQLAAEGIWVVDTYVGAALKAYELELISSRGLQSVVDETRHLLDEVEWDSSEQESAMRELVERDADSVLDVIRSGES